MVGCILNDDLLVWLYVCTHTYTCLFFLCICICICICFCFCICICICFTHFVTTVFVFLLVWGDGWVHPECWFTDAICPCRKWSVSNSDREERFLLLAIDCFWFVVVVVLPFVFPLYLYFYAICPCRKWSVSNSDRERAQIFAFGHWLFLVCFFCSISTISTKFYVRRQNTYF